MTRRSLNYFFAVFVFPLVVGAQVQKDAVLWISLNAEKKINKHFSGTFFIQNIFNQNLNELGAVFFDVGLGYRYNNHFSASGNYRLTDRRNLDNFYEQRQSFYADATAEKSFDRFKLTIRTRFQRSFYGTSLSENVYRQPKNYSRNKLSLRYRINWYWSVMAAEELFYRFDKNTIRAWRTSAALSHQFNLKNRIEFAYMIQQEDNVASPETDFISAVSYYYKF